MLIASFMTLRSSGSYLICCHLLWVHACALLVYLVWALLLDRQFSSRKEPRRFLTLAAVVIPPVSLRRAKLSEACSGCRCSPYCQPPNRCGLLLRQRYRLLATLRPALLS